jgi:uncharacterized protein (DUF2252 family)
VAQDTITAGRATLAAPSGYSGSVKERMAAGKALRKRVPRRAHGEWTPATGRPDPVSLLISQDRDRQPDLVPVRHGRMMTSPFAFYRGSAIVMAGDLSATPRTGIEVQACGDAHLANFGGFATPERNIVFDVNDFDETLPGPWEWDLKRLAASFVAAGRHRDFDADSIRLATLTLVKWYTLRLRAFAQSRFLDIWYARMDIDTLVDQLKGKGRRQTQQDVDKARLRDHLQAQRKLSRVIDGQRRIVDAPPLVIRLEHLIQASSSAADDAVGYVFRRYLRTIRPDQRNLLSRYTMVDAARKVVGVGSVGTGCYIVLMEGRDDGDPLFLQLKEATASVLEPYLRRSRFRNHGQRVVEGQRLTQAVSDIFLGWTQDADGRHYYWRQLRDVKGTADLDTITRGGLTLWAGWCGAALARAHARSGDAAMIAGYIGTGRVFPDAIAAFAEAYADQAERDHAVFLDAIRVGRLPVTEGL